MDEKIYEAEIVDTEKSLTIKQEKSDEKGKNMGVAALVFGILAVVFACCGLCDILFALPALLCAIIGMCQKKHNGRAIAGLILAIFSFIFMAVWSFYFLVIDNAHFNEKVVQVEEKGEAYTFEEYLNHYYYGEELPEKEKESQTEATAEEEKSDYEEFYDKLEQFMETYY